ncbi:MAG: hypothetical protein WBV22_01150 [Anaerolineaceae bacterium]
MTTEPITEYNYLGTHVTVYENRLELKLPGGLFGKKEMIVFRNIASIEKPPLLNCIEIKTNDRKKHKISLKPTDTIKLKEQIESLL